VAASRKFMWNLLMKRVIHKKSELAGSSLTSDSVERGNHLSGIGGTFTSSGNIRDGENYLKRLALLFS
jgi:hypothetical protein